MTALLAYFGFGWLIGRVIRRRLLRRAGLLALFLAAHLAWGARLHADTFMRPFADPINVCPEIEGIDPGVLPCIVFDFYEET